MDDKMHLLLKKLNLKRKKKKKLKKNKELQVELIERNLLIFPRNYNLT